MIRILIVLAAVVLCSIDGYSQSVDSVYWVVETNLRNPSYTIVHFYNYRNEEVHEVRMQGVYIDIRNPKQRKKLDLLVKEYNERILTLSKRKNQKSTI